MPFRPIALSAAFFAAIALGTVKLACYHQAAAGSYHPIGLLASATALALLWTAMLALRPRWSVVVWSVQTLWLLVNWGYATYFAAPLWWGTVVGAGGVGVLAIGHGALPLTSGMWWLLADLPALLVLHRLRRDPLPQRVAIIAGTLLAGLLGAQVTWAWVRLPAHEADPERIHPVSELVVRTGPLPVQIADLLRGSGPEPATGPTLDIPASGSRRDILIVQVESLDAGTLEWQLADGATAMPRLAARAAAGTYWPWCLAYHGPGGSSDGEFAVVNGCEPTWNAPIFNRRGYTFPHSLPKRLGEHGWSATMMLGLYGSFFDYQHIQPRVGYRWLGLEELAGVQHDGEFGVRDGEFVDAVLARLDHLPQPTLLHVTTMSGHIPWLQWHNIPECAGPQLAAAGTADDYARTLRYVDRHLDRLIATFLERRPNGLVVLFGDHSALIKADGYTSPAAWRDGVQWEFVPLLILGQDVPVRRGAVAACQLDVQRTILKAAGWSGSIPTLGMDLLDPTAVPGPLLFHGHRHDRAQIAAWATGLDRGR